MVADDNELTPEPERIIITGVTWEPAPPNDENAEQGGYTFIPLLPDGYSLADGVELPEINVLIGGAAVALDVQSDVLPVSVDETVMFDGIQYIIRKMPQGGGNGEVVVGDNSSYSGENLILPPTISVSGGPNDGTFDVVGISPVAFYRTKLKSVDLSACTALTAIGYNAFLQTASLTDVAFPASLTSIGLAAFAGTGLKSVDLSVCTGMTEIGTQIFLNTTSLTDVTLPSSVISIGEGAFKNTGLTSVDLSAYTSLTTIGPEAFATMPSLTDVIFPASLISIGELAFWETGLTSVDLSVCTGLTTIGVRAFVEARFLTDVVFPASLISIGKEAFYFCIKLTSVTFKGTTPPAIGNGAFLTSPPGGTVYYPEGASGFDADWMSPIGMKGWTLKGVPAPPSPTKYAVTVKGGTGGGDYVEGEPVTITAARPPSGHHFTGWTITPDVTFTSGGKNNETATFSMPAQAVTATANYKNNSTSNSGSGGKGSGSGGGGSTVTNRISCMGLGKRQKKVSGHSGRLPVPTQRTAGD